MQCLKWDLLSLICDIIIIIIIIIYSFRVFHISVSWLLLFYFLQFFIPSLGDFFIEVWVTASLLRSPELFSVF